MASTTTITYDQLKLQVAATDSIATDGIAAVTVAAAGPTAIYLKPGQMPPGMTTTINDETYLGPTLTGGGEALDVNTVLGLTGPEDGLKANNYSGGSQFIVNADRVLLNAKEDYLMLFGDKGVAISSPSHVNIDADEGVTIFGLDGLFLGIPGKGDVSQKRVDPPTTKAMATIDQDYEPIVLGTKLENWLEDLISILQAGSVTTGLGNGYFNEITQYDLASMKARIPEIVSTYAFVDGISHENVLPPPTPPESITYSPTEVPYMQAITAPTPPPEDTSPYKTYLEYKNMISYNNNKDNEIDDVDLISNTFVGTTGTATMDQKVYDMFVLMQKAATAAEITGIIVIQSYVSVYEIADEHRKNNGKTQNQQQAEVPDYKTMSPQEYYANNQNVESNDSPGQIASDYTLSPPITLQAELKWIDAVKGRMIDQIGPPSETKWKEGLKILADSDDLGTTQYKKSMSNPPQDILFFPNRTSVDPRRTGRLVVLKDALPDSSKDWLLNNGPKYGFILFGNLGIYYVGVNKVKAVAKLGQDQLNNLLKSYMPDDYATLIITLTPTQINDFIIPSAGTGGNISKNRQDAYDKAETKFPGFKAKLRQVAVNIGVTEEVLTTVMYKESGIITDIENSIGCVGLIQFCPDKPRGSTKTISGTKYDLATIKAMSGSAQLDVVEKYFKALGFSSNKPANAGQLYGATFYPISKGKAQDWIVGSERSPEYAIKVAVQNRGIADFSTRTIDGQKVIDMAAFERYVYS